MKTHTRIWQLQNNKDSRTRLWYSSSSCSIKYNSLSKGSITSTIELVASSYAVSRSTSSSNNLLFCYSLTCFPLTAALSSQLYVVSEVHMENGNQQKGTSWVAVPYYSLKPSKLVCSDSQNEMHKITGEVSHSWNFLSKF